VGPELDFLFAREDEFGTLCRLQASGELPLRVTHNDTKLNNVLLDPETGKARCVLDLDTVMPGLSASDFGDAIRFGASTALEDETDLSKVSLDLGMYRAFLQGYLDACGASLTDKEIEVLPLGAKIITGELAARFLKDYLDGRRLFSPSTARATTSTAPARS
jgi:Ser/Thr protein kinase RdoA (MazF antagonist)